MIAIPALHPAHLLRSSEGSQGQAKFEQTTIGDFRKAVALLKRRPNWDERIIWEKKGDRYRWLFPDLEDVLLFCRQAKGKLCAVDVETTGEHPLDCQLICVGIACANGSVICVPILRQGGLPYWSPADFARVWECLRWLLQDPGTPKLFHNFAFDCLVLWAVGIVVGGLAEDTMAAHHVLDSELPHGLGYVGSICLEVPFWKDLGGETKGDHRWLDLPDEELRSYNCRDCLVTLRSLPALLAGLDRWQLRGLYREEIEASYEMMLASIRGMLIDPVKRWELSHKLVAQRDGALSLMRHIVGDPTFNPASPVQLQKVFFEQLKFPVVKYTDKGSPSTDKEAMSLLALYARAPAQQAFLKALVDWRVPDKQITTCTGRWDPVTGSYVGGFPILWDGRLHPTWKLLTTSGRFASSPNAQNWNGAIKALFRAADGCKLVGVDLSQAEVRGISYLANDAEVLAMYVPDENGEVINLHTVNTALIFGLRAGVPDKKGGFKDTNTRTEAYIAAKATSPMLLCDNPGRWKASRTLAKNFRFGWQYGALPDTLYKVIRAKRDPETNEALFSWVELSMIEAAKIRQEKIDPAIPLFWDRECWEIQKQGFSRCPLSGRVRWFRGGFKRNEMLNVRTQTLIASHVNKAMLRIAKRVRAGTGGEAGLVCQVHDMLGIEAPDRFVDDVKRIYKEELNTPFVLPGFPEARLPCDEPQVGTYLHEV